MNIVIFNNYIEKKKYFIKSKLICENKIKINNMEFHLAGIDLHNNLDNKNYKIDNLKEKFKAFIN